MVDSMVTAVVVVVVNESIDSRIQVRSVFLWLNVNILVFYRFRRVNKQVQFYDKDLKNSSFGVEKFSFSLGLLFIFNWTE